MMPDGPIKVVADGLQRRRMAKRAKLKSLT
jgi:hypothetical protein